MGKARADTFNSSPTNFVLLIQTTVVTLAFHAKTDNTIYGGGVLANAYTRSWSHQCTVFQGLHRRVYVNCASAACVPDSYTSAGSYPSAQLPYSMLGQGVHDSVFYGWLAEARYYSRALTAAEVYAVLSFDCSSLTPVKSVNTGLLAY